jgi:hypothetical protein
MAKAKEAPREGNAVRDDPADRIDSSGTEKEGKQGCKGEVGGIF